MLDLFPVKINPDGVREVRSIGALTANRMVERHHYLHRETSISFAFGLYVEGELLGVITFGTPPSRHLQQGVCPTSPDSVIELNRLWCDDVLGRNTESWFIGRALALLPPLIVVSYADTAHNHRGTIYRASNFFYSGWTDMERKTPRFDYVTDGKHSRAAFRKGGSGLNSEKVRRKPKVKYWTVTGNRRERHNLKKLCAWPVMDWKLNPPPT